MILSPTLIGFSNLLSKIFTWQPAAVWPNCFKSNRTLSRLLPPNLRRKHISQLRCTAVFALCRAVIWCLETLCWQCGLNWSSAEEDTRSCQTQPSKHRNDRFKPNRWLLTISAAFTSNVTLFQNCIFQSELFYFTPNLLILFGFVMPSLRGNVETSSVWLSRGTGHTCMCAERVRTTPSAPTWTGDAGHR